MENLKQGDVIYFIENFAVQRYTYLCVHPNNSQYHIFIDQSKNPIKVFSKEIEKMIAQGYKSYEDAREGLALKHEDMAKYIREQVVYRKAFAGYLAQ